MAAVNGGQTSVSVSFGIGSYNMNTRETNGIWTWGENSTLENIGYSLGALGNVSDIALALNNTPSTLYTQTKNPDGTFDGISHSGIESNTGETLMSYGPNGGAAPTSKVGFLTRFRTSTADYDILKNLSLSQSLNVNKHIFTALKSLGGNLPYQGFSINCVNMSSLGLWLNGIPNIGIHPFLLYVSIGVYNTGLYNMLSYQLINR